MCTITMLAQPGTLILASNRDELRTRGNASPPQIRQLGSVRAIYPEDSDAKGTWVGANDHGCVITLLNSYQDDEIYSDPDRTYTSRGKLVLELLEKPSIDEMVSALTSAHESGRLAELRPFVLAFAQRLPNAEAEAWRASWNGITFHLHQHELPLFFASSGFDPVRVAQARHTQLSPLLGQEAKEMSTTQITRLFAQHDPENSPYSVSMSRDDARTVSHTMVSVTDTEVTLTYHEDAPHLEPSTHTKCLKIIPV